MDREPRLTSRDAAPAAARSDEKEARRSMLDTFKSFRTSYIPDLVVSRLKEFKTAANTLGSTRIGGQIKPSLTSSLLTSPGDDTKSQLHRPNPYSSLDIESGLPDGLTKAIDEHMYSPSLIASQKRKQAEEHDDAPFPLKPKSRPAADDPEKRHIVQQWVNQQSRPDLPTSSQLLPGVESSRRCSSPLPLARTDTNGDAPVSAPSRASTVAAGLNRELLDLIGHRRASIHHSQPQGVTSFPQPPSTHRRDSTATTSHASHVSFRDSIFSSCPSAATGLTSPSQISLALTSARRSKADSRSSSFFSKASPRSSIASSSPSPQFFLSRTLSYNSVGRQEDLDELVKHPLPNVPDINGLRTHPTFLGMNLGNSQAAVIIDQVVKMGHMAQERRVNPRSPVDVGLPPFDKASLFAATTGAVTTDLAPITETASDDGASVNQKMQLDGPEPSLAQNCSISNTDGRVILDNATTCRSVPSSPESTNRLSHTITGDSTVDSATPDTSVAGVSEMSMSDLAQNLDDESDDNLSDITDYTEESLLDAVDAFGPELSNPLLLSIILTFKDDVLRLVLARINLQLGDDNGITQHTSGRTSGSSSGRSPSGGSAQGQTPSSQRGGTRKRELDDGDDGSREDDDDDRGKRPKPASPMPSDLEMRYTRLACPFFKRYPGTKWKGACCGPGFTTVHRIKEHVYRKHDHPYCQRCHATFTDHKVLEQHLQAETPCTVRKGPLGHQGITPEQRARLKSRRKTNRDANQSEAEKWTDLYTLLFPEVPKEEIPSPYYDLKSCEELLNPAVAAAFRRFLDEDLPTRVARELEERLMLVPGAQSNFVQAQLPDIIRSCLQEALNHVPAQLLARDDATASAVTSASPATSMVNSPDSHNTAQIGAQFTSMALQPQDLLPKHEESSSPEVTLPDYPQPWAQTHDHHNPHLGAIFEQEYFPGPLVEGGSDGFMGANNNNNTQGFHAPNAFTTIGFPSAMISGTPMMSPSLPDMALDGFDFADAGGVAFRGTLASMANTTFLFTQEEKGISNGTAGGHQGMQQPQSHQYTY